jgi:hypothetical protein
MMRPLNKYHIEALNHLRDHTINYTYVTMQSHVSLQCVCMFVDLTIIPNLCTNVIVVRIDY